MVGVPAGLEHDVTLLAAAAGGDVQRGAICLAEATAAATLIHGGTYQGFGDARFAWQGPRVPLCLGLWTTGY